MLRALLTASSLASSLAGSEIADRTRSAKRKAIGLALAGLFGLTSYVGAIVAGGLALVPIYGAVMAALIVALVSLSALIGVGIVFQIMHMRRKRLSEKRKKMAQATAASLLAAGSSVAKTSPLTSLAVALVGGFVAANILGGDKDS